MSTPEPLWRVMREASHTADAIGIASTDQFIRACAAAELRAIADWLEAMWAAQRSTSESSLPFVRGLSMGMKLHMGKTLNILRAEADKAEAGE